MAYVLNLPDSMASSREWQNYWPSWSFIQSQGERTDADSSTNPVTVPTKTYWRSKGLSKVWLVRATWQTGLEAWKWHATSVQCHSWKKIKHCGEAVRSEGAADWKSWHSLRRTGWETDSQANRQNIFENINQTNSKPHEVFTRADTVCHIEQSLIACMRYRKKKSVQCVWYASMLPPYP